MWFHVVCGVVFFRCRVVVYCFCGVVLVCFFFLMIRRPPRSTQGVSSAASDVYKRQVINSSVLLQREIEAEIISTPFIEKRFRPRKRCFKLLFSCNARERGVADASPKMLSARQRVSMLRCNNRNSAMLSPASSPI
eukprot:TRINITY_DN1021_c0_g1_i2.p2 TRINITY_DN1021_c0_g1~~TRINITY_DN1021_c0_g1_i2.p2  ORF type:complete len:136 (+),score=9.25 TRINITY_DN1021_c0_g1_i2:2-409(+)